ncbi:exported hypothetical protein [Gammaproteobacteria bacterium]
MNRLILLSIFLASFLYIPSNTASLNDTGIVTCSDAAQNGLPCPVSGFPGQDAEYGDHPFTFTKLDASGNSLSASATQYTCVRDNITGLVWEVKTRDGGFRDQQWTYTWYDSHSSDGNQGTSSDGVCYASGRCDTEKYTQDVNAIRLCGFHDWRMPHPGELAGIVDYSIPYIGHTINADYFPNTLSSAFWSSAPKAAYPSGAWGVYFGFGSVNISDRSQKLAVRLVRGEPVLASWVVNSDGTVTDQATGLIWARCSELQKGSGCAGRVSLMTWDQALAAARSSHLGDYQDWRLPNVKELQSIVDYTADSPSINSAIFPNVPPLPYWTSSPDIGASDGAWAVDFGSGAVSSNSRGYDYAIRLVRGGQIFNLGVSRAGVGTGTVTSRPAGINCGVTCAAIFPGMVPVTLTATPASGYFFTGWCGACLGMGPCTLKMDADKAVTAGFMAGVGPCSASSRDLIYKAYTSYYARCPDQEGFTYWCERLDNPCGDLGSILSAFGTSAEYTNRFGGMSDDLLITSLYRDIFNRGVEPVGLNFYLGLLEKYRQTWRDSHGGDLNGATEYALSRLALDILNGAQGSDAKTLKDRMAACPVL